MGKKCNAYSINQPGESVALYSRSQAKNHSLYTKKEASVFIEAEQQTRRKRLTKIMLCNNRNRIAHIRSRLLAAKRNRKHENASVWRVLASPSRKLHYFTDIDRME